MTAKLSAADADSPKNLSLISYSDLAKFDSCLKDSCQVLDQLTEINSSICRKIKQHFVIVKCILRINQFHFQTMFADFFLADFKCIFFFQAVLFLPVLICLCGNAKDFFQRMDHLILTHFFRSEYNSSELHTAGSLYDHMITDLHFVVFRIKIINLSDISESYTNNFCHSISP